MSPKQVDALIENWTIDREKTFYYYEYLLDKEVLTIVRKDKNLFEVVRAKSSVPAGPWTKEQIIKILGRDGLTLEEFNTTWRYWDKTGGCECGAWKSRDPDCHSPWCKKYRG